MARIIIAQGYECIVDDWHYDRLSRHKWQIRLDSRSGRPYAIRGLWFKGKLHSLSMHRAVLGLLPGDPVEVDHRDNEATLDNRESNLRHATRSQNNCNRGMRRDNSSGIKGVSADPNKAGFWKAQIMKNKKAFNLGSFPTKEEAGQAYADAAVRLHGEFARIARST